MIDIETARFWIDLLWKAGTVAVLVWLAIKQRATANKDAIEALARGTAERIGGHETRMIRLEERVAAMPGHGDLEKIHDRISKVSDVVNGVRQEMSGLREAVVALRRSVDLLNQHHLKEPSR